MKTSVYFYNVSRNLVDESHVLCMKEYSSFDINKAKKTAIDLFLKLKSKKSNGILIRILKENNKNFTTNEYYVYYDGIRFKNKFDLYWDMKEEFIEFGISRYEKVTNLKDM